MSTPHESVVSRPTTTRLYQVLELNDSLDEGMRATLPSTVNEKGVVVASPTSRSKIGGVSQFNLGEYGSIDDAPLVDLDVTAGGLKSRSSAVGFAQSVGFTSSVDRTIGSPKASEGGIMSRRGSKPGTVDGARSVQSGFSGRSSTGRSTGTSQIMLGPPSVLVVRLKGDVYPVETVRKVIEKNPYLRVMERFTLPETTGFIPPPGRKYFDPHFIAEQEAIRSKGRINLSAIKDRDVELRAITHNIIDSLFKDVLTQHDVRSYCRSALAGINTEAIEETSRVTDEAGRGKKLSGNSTYGLYFSEVTPKKSVLRAFVIELKHLGYVDVHGEKNRAPSHHEVPPQQWLEAGDELLAVDEASFAIEVNAFTAALEHFNLNPMDVFIKRSVPSP